MAVKYIGVSKTDSGETPTVTVANSTTSSDIELAIDDTNGVTAAEVVHALQGPLLKELLDNGVTPPS